MAQAVKALEKTIQEEIEAYQQLQKGKTHKNVVNLEKLLVALVLCAGTSETLFH